MRTLALCAAFAALVMPLAAQAQQAEPAARVQAIAGAQEVVVSNGRTFVITGTPMRRNYREFGGSGLGAGEAAIAKRGRFTWDQCPDGAIVTPFGTCAARR